MKEYNSNEGAISTNRAFAVLLPLCLFSILLACLFISIVNDIYAFVKPDTELSVVISLPMTDSELAEHLKDVGVIENPTVFTFYLRSKGLSQGLGQITGEWTLNSNMSYREIVSEFF